MKAINERGFALVEVGAALPVLILGVAGVFAVVYLCFANAWLKDTAEETALCVAERVPVEKCRREFAGKADVALPFGQFTKLSVKKRGSLIIVQYVFRTAALSLQNKIQLQLPVSKRATGIL